jgi:S1-C subfamily serine protease
VVRLRHLYPPDTGLGANVGVIRTTSKLLFLVELLNLTFELELDVRRDSNVKFAPLADARELKNPPAGLCKNHKEEGTTYSTGAGFFINGDGYLLTNAHVVDGCKDAIARQGNADVQPATIVARETTNDLAILKVAEKSPAFGKFRGTPQIRLGDTIVVFGYPLAGLLSSTGNLSTGLVASLAGASDDVSKPRISAPVRSGNSGGAVVDQSGHGVGIVVAKSNYQARGSEEYPDIEVIQNVNFANKAGMAQFFLEANQVGYSVKPPGDDLKTPDVADIARNFTAQVMCEIKT